MAWYHFVVLAAAAFLGGAINAVAGGGTLLTFPSLLWAQASATVANATSTVALWPGALSSFWGYRGELRNNRQELIALAVPSIVGGVLGTWLFLRTDENLFKHLVPYLILLATLLFMVQEPLMAWQRRRAQRARGPEEATAAEPQRAAGRGRWAVVLAFQFLVGVYGGYFGAGIGILMLAAFGFLGFTNIHHMNALKNLNAMCINGIASVWFILAGRVNWPLAALMAVAAILGGYFGADTARRLGQRRVRQIVVLIGVVLTISLLWQR